MKQHLYPLLILLLTTCCARSQDTVQIRNSLSSRDTLRSGISQDSSIRATLVQGYKYPNLVYSANGQILSNRDILARLQLYPEPADELQKYHNGRTGLAVWLGVFLASGIIAAVEGRQGNQGVGYTLVGVSAGALVMALVSGVQAGAHYDRAIRIYNRRFVP